MADAEYHRNWRANNRERSREIQRNAARKRRLEHPQECRDYDNSRKVNNTEKMRRWRAKNPIQCRKLQIEKDYGISWTEYESRLLSQNNLCGLCKKPFDITSKNTTPDLDHNHVTGQLRDFIHHGCNLALGVLQDNAGMFRLAAEYLERHDMSDIQESYPTPNTGVNAPVEVIITGAGVTEVQEGEYQATVALNGQSQVQLALTATTEDINGMPTTNGTVNWVSFGTKIDAAGFAANNPNDLQESYPHDQEYAGDCVVNSSGVVTAKKPGSYLIDAQVISFDKNPGDTMEGSQDSKSSFIYSTLVLTVDP